MELQLDELTVNTSRLSLQRVPFVYKLSCEIWIKVFTCCDPLLDDDSYWRWNLKDEVERVRKPYLLELSQVCSGWHYIVMHAAELWSNIVVNTTVWKDSRMLLQLLETSLARSGDHPLSIDVTCGRRADSCCPVVLRLLGRRAMRWKHFRLDCWGPSSFNVILTEARGEFPLLQTLDVDYCGEEWMQCSVFAVAAPLLHTVAIRGCIPSLPWKQLRHLDITSEDPLNSLSLLPQLPSGASARVCLYWKDKDTLLWKEGDTPIHSITSHISALTLLFDYDPPNAFLVQVLRFLALPDLTSFALRSGEHEAVEEDDSSLLPWTVPDYLCFAGLHNGLTALDIQVELTDVQILEGLHFLPVLEHFALSDCSDGKHTCITDEFLEGLVWTSHPTCLVPRLTSISLTSLLAFNPTPCERFVESRLQPRLPPFVFSINWIWTDAKDTNPDWVHNMLLDVKRGNRQFNFTIAEC
ncbi:hypothetical protein B0H11DRAFT_1917990 [Mycena galericulata]|nr:hypothetical protein B0H11DRAFT_1933536 [Mycena galericulata]KAJ7475295.1 hypothetical protein B0H11DRAFT_1917990 [Mycena galericulata]